MLKETKMTNKTKQMIALMEAFNAVNGTDNASQSLNESTQVDEMRRGADGKLRGRRFSYSAELQQKADRLYDAVYSLLGSGPKVKQQFKKVGINLDKIANQMMEIPLGGLETSYTGDAAAEDDRDTEAFERARDAAAAEEQNEAAQSVHSERVEANVEADILPSVTADKLSKEELMRKVEEIENDAYFKHLVRMHKTYSAKIKELGENLEEQELS